MFWKGKGAPKTGVSESTVQHALHAMELGAWAKYIKNFLFVLAVFILLLIYQSNQFRGLELPEAMDQAQLARNIARGEGYTTKFVRPASAWMFREMSENREPRLKEPHPDVYNPPLFPHVLALAFKFQSPSFEVKPVANQPYTKYPPETLVLFVCEFFFLAGAVLIYLLARQLFDKRIAFVVVLLFLLSDLLWRYSISGLPTTMLVFLFLCAQVCLVNAYLLAEQEHRKLWVWGLSAAVGLFCGLCVLTKYSAAWLILPVLGYVLFSFGKQRWICLALVALVFAAVIAPWLARNNGLSGKWFGLSSYAVIEQTEKYPDNQLERSFKGIAEPAAKQAQKKLLIGAREFAEGGWLQTGAGLMATFFLGGLLYRFKKPDVLAYRRFVVVATLLTVVVSCLDGMITTREKPLASPANLTVLLGPGILILGTAFFFLLFDRINIKLAILKHATLALIVVICAAPLVFSLLPPRRPVVRYPSPPYYEPVISIVSKWITPEEMMATDIPWAVAWYGDRRALWIPNTLEEFYQINDYHQRIAGLYLTPMSFDGRFLSDILKGEMRPWAPLFFGQMPPGFPLVTRTGIPGFEPDQSFYSDRARWTDEK